MSQTTANAQPELPVLEQPAPAPRVSAEQVQAVIAALQEGCWRTAKELQAITGLGDRELRIVAQEHDTEIVTGNRGYRLFSACTTEEICTCAQRLISQGEKMIARGIHLRNAAHRRLHHRQSNEPGAHA